MSEHKPNPNYILDMNYILMCYLKILFPKWKNDPKDLADIAKLLEGEVMTRVSNDCAMVKQQCMQNSENILHILILEKASTFKKERTEILKQFETQINQYGK